jgi:hypothetical protein
VSLAGLGLNEKDTAMRVFLREGEGEALALRNRGPLRFEADGSLPVGILAAYWRQGFYVFERVFGADEIADIAAEVAADGARMTAGGDDGLVVIAGSLQLSDACLTAYGHPGLLAAAAQINGEDFIPLDESLVIRKPHKGTSLSWHQEGQTHWESPDIDAGSHGLRFAVQLYDGVAGDGAWILPASHTLGRVDIKSMVARGGERISGAVPILCGPGDVVMVNRQAVHGYIANDSPDCQVTMTFGFAPRASVLNVEAKAGVYDAARIRRRSRLIPYAIDARRQRFPSETPFVYVPLAGAGIDYRWTEAARADIPGYEQDDLII